MSHKDKDSSPLIFIRGMRANIQGTILGPFTQWARNWPTWPTFPQSQYWSTYTKLPVSSRILRPLLRQIKF